MIILNNTTDFKGDRSRGNSHSTVKSANENSLQHLAQNSLSSTIFQLNKNTSSNKITLDKQQSSLLSVGTVANPVVIIHQNQLKSTNLDQKNPEICNDILQKSERPGPDFSDVTNKVEKTNECQVRTNEYALNNREYGKELNDMLNELKYMKGYVNVLKERFTRKALDYENHQSLQPCGSSGNCNSSVRFSGDIGRRRSISPFVQYGSNSCVHQSVKSKFTNFQAQPNNSSSIQLKERKLFASSDDLRHQQHHKCRLFDHRTRQNEINGFGSNLNFSSEQIVKCTYSNEINKDELPRPNFVSSVKNLFEKHITGSPSIIKSSSGTSSFSNSSSSTTLNHSNHLNNINSNIAQSNQNSQNQNLRVQPTNHILQTTNGSVGSQGFSNNLVIFHQNQYSVDSSHIKQNGSLVYEHSEGNDKTFSSSPSYKKKNIDQHVQSKNITHKEDSQLKSTKVCQNNLQELKETNSKFSDQKVTSLQSTNFIVDSKIKTDKNTSTSNRSVIKSSGNIPTSKNVYNQQNSATNNTTQISKIQFNYAFNNLNETLSTDKENKDSANEEHITTSNRVMTFKERKEIFSKMEPHKNTNEVQNHYLSSPKKIQDPKSHIPISDHLNVNQMVKRIKVEDNISCMALNQSKLTLGQKPDLIKDGKEESIPTLIEATTSLCNVQAFNSIYSNSDTNSYESIVSIDNNNNTTEKNDQSKKQEINLNDHSLILHPISSENLEMSADRILEQQEKQAKLKAKSAVKMKTFFGGKEIKCFDQIQNQLEYSQQSASLLPSSNSILPQSNLQNQLDVNETMNNLSASSLDYFNFEFVGAGIKLEKSILIVNSSNPNITFRDDSKRTSRVKNGASLRVNFTDVAETYEYPSYEYLLQEMGIMDDEEKNKTKAISFNGDFDETHDDSYTWKTSQTQDKPIDLLKSPTNFTQFLPGNMLNELVNNNSMKKKNENQYLYDINQEQYNHRLTRSRENSGENSELSYEDEKNQKRLTYDYGSHLEEAIDFFENSNFNPDSKREERSLRLGKFTNFRPSWHTIDYELGGIVEKKTTVNISSNLSEQKHAHDENEGTKSTLKNDIVITRDILPVNDDEIKRWSCEMDSNILF